MLPRGKAESGADQTLDALLTQHGFDRLQHEQTRTDLKEGRIGLAQNRLPPSAVIEDVQEGDVVDATSWLAGPSSAPQPSSGAGVPPVTPGVSPALTTSEKNPRGRDSLATGGTPAPLTPPPFKAFERDRPASISSRRLPHWRQEGATYFVTFRLKDALPRAAVERLQTERDNWLRRHPEPHMSEQLDELHELGFSQLDQELDQGYGACVLNEPEVAEIVEGALRHFDGERYWLGSYVIMPNHVHVLVRPVMQHSLADILHSWKSFTAHAIGNALGRTGSLWQDESFDHIVRNEHQLGRFGLYISANPSKARLAPGKFRLGGGLAMGQPSSGAGVPPVTPGVSPALTTSEENPRGRVPLATGGTPTPLKPSTKLREIGLASLRAGELAVVTLAAGAGSRWTQGAGVVKALHPFCKLGGRHRTFMETHLAKSRRISRQAGTPIPHIFTTSYLTHAPTEEFLARQNHYGYEGLLYLSPGKSVGLRMIPTVRDLRFVWEEMPQQILDEQQQKVRDSLRHALINWARSAGEASDYTDNLPLQCLHPVGHWYEVPNLLRNGVLARLLAERPQLKHLMLHNIDTLGADVDPAVLGWHISSGACLSFEVITRRLEDRGGGLARVNGRVRLVEGLAMPREEVEFDLSYYNSNTCWIDLDKLLAAFALTRPDLKDEAKVTAAIRHLAAKIPTYITIKEVKKRWGHGQEDIFPVTQFEKLWVDMTALPELESRFILVPRLRGQQLKDQAQLDGWLRDGSAAYVESLCEYQD
jgi:REP element-mobilizing transposase RayT